MTYFIRLATSASVLALLAACGGGGGTSSPSPTTPPPADPVPASTSTADLIAFASGGASETLDAGVTRQTRSFVQGNQAGVVAVDSLEGTDLGLVQYRLGNDVFIYRLTGEQMASVTMPSGTYSGPLDMNYRFDAGSGWSVLSGDATLALNFETGDVAIGGMASNSQHSIELFGDAVLVGNSFADTNTILRLRDAAAGGSFIRDEAGTVSGLVGSSGGNQAIFGTVESVGAASGFEAGGGFAATLFQN